MLEGSEHSSSISKFPFPENSSSLQLNASPQKSSDVISKSETEESLPSDRRSRSCGSAADAVSADATSADRASAASAASFYDEINSLALPEGASLPSPRRTGSASPHLPVGLASPCLPAPMTSPYSPPSCYDDIPTLASTLVVDHRVKSPSSQDSEFDC